jgi:hypothetical protein
MAWRTVNLFNSSKVTAEFDGVECGKQLQSTPPDSTRKLIIANGAFPARPVDDVLEKADRIASCTLKNSRAVRHYQYFVCKTAGGKVLVSL